jgi:hypothetical protein
VFVRNVLYKETQASVSLDHRSRAEGLRKNSNQHKVTDATGNSQSQDTSKDTLKDTSKHTKQDT